MADTSINGEVIEQIAKELAGKYHLDEEGLREVGRQLQKGRIVRRATNEAFAERFMAEHAGTFKRLGD